MTKNSRVDGKRYKVFCDLNPYFSVQSIKYINHLSSQHLEHEIKKTDSAGRLSQDLGGQGHFIENV